MREDTVQPTRTGASFSANWTYSRTFSCSRAPTRRRTALNPAVAPEPDALKRMYQHFGAGVTFEDATTIRDRQIFDHLRRWFEGDPQPPGEFDAEAVTNGTVHSWQDRFYVGVGGLQSDDWVDELAEHRANERAQR